MTFFDNARPNPELRRRHSGFTLIELLVVVAIISVLIAIMLPALIRARAAARTVVCADHIRHICIAIFEYADEYKNGPFPPNVFTPAPGRMWSDADRMGKIFALKTDVRGPAFTCPEDADAGRSYAMNVWASSEVDTQTAKSVTGSFWKSGTRGSQQLILIAEKWSTVGPVQSGWVSAPTIGLLGNTPGQRFGVAGGLAPLFNAGRFGLVNCEIPFIRHRGWLSRGKNMQPIGRVNIGYADGHVALCSDQDLADSRLGVSTLNALWSPKDRDLNKWP